MKHFANHECPYKQIASDALDSFIQVDLNYLDSFQEPSGFLISGLFCPIKSIQIKELIFIT